MKKNNVLKKILKFLNSYNGVLIALIIIILVVSILCYNVMRSNKIYLFSGENGYVNIQNGTVSLNYDINLLSGSDITYLRDKDIVVVDYTIGYYTLVNNKYIPIYDISDKDEEGLSLKAVLTGIGIFNKYEPAHNKYYFNKNKIKALDNGLYFKIKCTTKDGTKIDETLSLDLVKISK